MATQILLKRVYEHPQDSDGYRVLVDRLWPRGISHENLPYRIWAKNVAPSTELREWYHADPENRWPEFVQRYTQELNSSADFKIFVATISKYPVVTFLYASHDPVHNQAEILRNVTLQHLANSQNTQEA